MNAKQTAKFVAGIVFEIECLPEDDAPEGHFASGDDEQDAETVRFIHQGLEQGNEWAWCIVKVTATHPLFEDLEGVDYLGGCSYSSEADFCQAGGYYEQMKDEAAGELVAQVERLAASFKALKA